MRTEKNKENILRTEFSESKYIYRTVCLRSSSRSRTRERGRGSFACTWSLQYWRLLSELHQLKLHLPRIFEASLISQEMLIINNVLNYNISHFSTWIFLISAHQSLICCFGPQSSIFGQGWFSTSYTKFQVLLPLCTTAWRLFFLPLLNVKR